MTTLFLRFFAVALVAASALTAVPAHAFGTHAFHQRGERRARFAETLGLTAEQKTRIDEVRQANREARRSAHAALAAKRAALRNAMLADPNDRAAIEAATNEMNAARAEAQRTSLEMQRQIFATLTPEQREKVRTMRRNRARS